MEFIIAWLFGFLVSFFICLFVIKVLEKLDWFDDNVDVQNAMGFSLCCSLLWVVTIQMAVFFLFERNAKEESERLEGSPNRRPWS